MLRRFLLELVFVAIGQDCVNGLWMARLDVTKGERRFSVGDLDYFSRRFRLFPCTEKVYTQHTVVVVMTPTINCLKNGRLGVNNH
jgi:hypothetical protein